MVWYGDSTCDDSGFSVLDPFDASSGFTIGGGLGTLVALRGELSVFVVLLWLAAFFMELRSV